MTWAEDAFRWADNHNGFLLLLVTAAYVVITGWMAKQGRDSAEMSAAATNAAKASAASAERTAAATQAAAEASSESAASAAATAQALANAADALRAMIPVQFGVRMVGVIPRGLTLEVQCAVATLHIHSVRLARVAYPVPVKGLPTCAPLTQPIILEPTKPDHRLPRLLHPGEVLLASTDQVQAKYLEFASVEIDYSFGLMDEPVQTYRIPVEGFAGNS